MAVTEAGGSGGSAGGGSALPDPDAWRAAFASDASAAAQRGLMLARAMEDRDVAGAVAAAAAPREAELRLLRARRAEDESRMSAAQKAAQVGASALWACASYCLERACPEALAPSA